MLSRVRQEDVAKQQYNRSLMEQRMETLLSLKTNIQDNRVWHCRCINTRNGRVCNEIRIELIEAKSSRVIVQRPSGLDTSKH